MSRQNYQQFIFQKYEFDRRKLTAKFYYSLDQKINFTETITFPKFSPVNFNQPLLNKILFNLHLALGISYYKTYCPKKIIIRSGKLSEEQAQFWNELYTKGLGEFFYKNKIDFRGLVNFPFQKNLTAKPLNINFKNRALVPLGGGKDSCVVVEKLKNQQVNFDLITLGDSQIHREVTKVSGKKRLIIERQMDQQLLELNLLGAYNGHVPISSIYAWVSILAAALYNYRYLIFANEKSANFGNVKYLGENINHQYSKSFAFEKNFSDYLNKYITSDLKYFSLLRRYSELKIVELFSHYPKYFSTFSSCNRNFKIIKTASPRWCGECPKCAFAFSQLAAFLPKDKVTKIFGQNLYANPKLLNLFLELLGEKNFKPFDCVGEPNEVKAAMLLSLKQPAFKNNYILKYFSKNVASRIKDKQKLISQALAVAPENNIPENFKKIIILGGAHEGQYAINHLQKKYPGIKLTIADQKTIKITKNKNLKIVTGKNYLKNISEFDLIIKSPGIPNSLPEIKSALDQGVELTSVPNIFFRECAGTIIGVTGTKGKSTTASLIYKILKTAKKPAHLVGNIGVDPLTYLEKKNNSNQIFVYELSSYQLSSLNQSPQIAVFINIFPDHLPYHQGFGNYYQAKTNITNHQKANDYFVYNSRYHLIKQLASKTISMPLDYLRICSVKNNWLYYRSEKILPIEKIKLLGQHNLENIMAAICVAKILKIENKTIARSLGVFTNLKHRLEFVGQYKNINFYDDAISTTPESTIAALEVFKNKIGTIFLGGEDRGYNFKELTNKIYQYEIKNIVLFPDSGAKIKLALTTIYRQHRKPLPKILETKSMAQAVAFAYKNTNPGQVCLLSTASPSYSIFKNFEEKGDLFQAEIKKQAK